MKRIDHIAILVDDLEKCQKWYEDNCGAVISFNDRKYKRLKMENTTIALIDRKYYPANHIGILVENYEDLPENGERIQHRDGTTGVYQTDPEGNVVEYIYYSPEFREKFGY